MCPREACAGGDLRSDARRLDKRSRMAGNRDFPLGAATDGADLLRFGGTEPALALRFSQIGQSEFILVGHQTGLRNARAGNRVSRHDDFILEAPGSNH